MEEAIETPQRQEISFQETVYIFDIALLQYVVKEHSGITSLQFSFITSIRITIIFAK
jgi:hypothetical protein